MRENSMAPFRLLSLSLSAALVLLMIGCAKPPEADSRKAPPLAQSAKVGGAKQAAGSDEHGEEGESSTAVKMDDDALEAAGIRLQTLQPSLLSEELRAPGEVVDNAYGTTLITPRVAALVVRRHAKLGDEVRAGAPLVALASVEVSDAQAELRIAEQEWHRVSTLGRDAVAGRRISEAKVAVDRARAKAQAYGFPGTENGGVNGQFTLSAPHAGRITSDAFVVGERIEPGTTLFRLVDESIVWVDAKVPSAMSLQVRPGSPATVVFNGERLSGTVQEAAHRTSDATRNAVVRIEVPNPGDRLHGGDFVEVFFESVTDRASATSVSVPNEALVQFQGDTVVFRRHGEGVFEPAPVRSGEVVGDRTLIREGLKPGDVVVVQGAFAIKSQMLKSQLGDEE